MPSIDRIPGAPTRIRRALDGIGSDFVPYTGAIKDVDLGTFNFTTTGLGTFGNLDVDTLNLNANVISDSTGTISFDNENLTTTSLITAGNFLTTGNVTIDSDSSKLLLGDGQDASLYYDGSNLYIDPAEVGSGAIVLWGDVKTDRWVESDTNTFLGVDVVGADHLAHGSGSEGWYNTALGCQAFESNTTGYENSALGYRALYSNSTGLGNTAVGVLALRANTTASANCAVGFQTLYSNTTGSQNNAMGYQALRDNNTGTLNNAVGYQALTDNISGLGNNAVGYQALKLNTTGQLNNATGYQVLLSNTDGDENNATGYQSLYSNTIGNQNNAMGSKSLYSNTEGFQNNAQGYQALYLNTTGDRNIGLGTYAGYRQTIADDQLFIDNRQRADAATELTNAIIYGVMAAAPADQDLYLNADVFLKADSRVLYFGAANDATITFDGDSLNIVANAVTGGDNLEITANLIDLGASPITTSSTGTFGGCIINGVDVFNTNSTDIRQVGSSSSYAMLAGSDDTNGAYYVMYGDEHAGAPGDFYWFIGGTQDPNSIFKWFYRHSAGNTELMRLTKDVALSLYGGIASFGDGGTTNYLQISATGDLKFVGSAGLTYGELSAYDEGDTIAIGGAGIANKVQVTTFDVSGPSNNMTPSVAESHITVDQAGHYLCTVSISIESTVAGGAKEFGFAVFKNDGATLFENCHSNRKVAGGGGDTGSISLSGIFDLAVSDTIELWCWNEDDAEDIVIDDVTLTLVQVGGT